MIAPAKEEIRGGIAIWLLQMLHAAGRRPVTAPVTAPARLFQILLRIEHPSRRRSQPRLPAWPSLEPRRFRGGDIGSSSTKQRPAD